jgi:LEA14-like dessication related protein
MRLLLQRFSLPISVVIIFFSSIIFIGCQSLVQSALEKPQVKFHSLALRDAHKEGATAIISLDVSNPNSIALEIDQLNYVLDIGGREIAKSQIKEFARLGARSTSRLEIPVPFLYSQVFASVLDLISKGSAAYRVRGDARVGIFSLPFDQGGEIQLH